MEIKASGQRASTRTVCTVLDRRTGVALWRWRATGGVRDMLRRMAGVW